MRELKRTYRILIAAIVFLFVILIGFLTIGTQKYPFISGPKDALSNSIKGDYKVSPVDVAKSVINKDEKIVFIDIRSQYDFLKGHLPNAKSIYTADILDKENFKYFEGLKDNGIKAVLYGESATDANIPYMILKQIGVENISILNCGYDFFVGKKLDSIASITNLNLDDEVAMINFSKYISDEKIKEEERKKEEEKKAKSSTVKKTSTKSNTVKKKVVPKRKLVIPEPEEEEEDEGC